MLERGMNDLESRVLTTGPQHLQLKYMLQLPVLKFIRTTNSVLKFHTAAKGKLPTNSPRINFVKEI